jgi:hypothetical protein
MTAICDFSNQSISIPAIKAAGLVGIMSYTSDYPYKNLSQANFNEAVSLGLTINLVCEQGNQPALRGALGGIHDSIISNQQANALGYDPTAAIYYVAEDPYKLGTSSWPTVETYFRALPWGGHRPIGAYGSLPLVTHLINLGLATYGMVVQTWGGTNSQVHLEQMVGANTFGLPIDVDTVLKADYGQMPRPAQPVQPPSTAKEYNMLTRDPVSGGYWGVRSNGGVYTFDGAPYIGPLAKYTAQWGIGTVANPVVGIAADGVGGFALLADGSDPAMPHIYNIPANGQYAT